MITKTILLPLTGFLQKNKVPLILTAATIVLYNYIPREELEALILLGMLIPIFAIYKFNASIAIGYGVLLLIIAAVSTSVKNETFAGQMAVSSYLLLIVGITCLLIELFRAGDSISNIK